MNRLFMLMAWLWIALPLAWGVYHSALKSLPLFTRQNPPSAPAPAPAVAPKAPSPAQAPTSPGR